jgi:hypothetical protein
VLIDEAQGYDLGGWMAKLNPLSAIGLLLTSFVGA